jgi:uncharacterized damage-inducible protein DinB
MDTIIAELFRHHLWANLRLIDACAELTADQLDATAPGTYGSTLATLAHMEESAYVAAARGESRPIRIPAGTSLGDLRLSFEATGEALIELAERTAVDGTVAGEWRGAPYTMLALVPLLQAIDHADQHRAQIMTIMGAHGIEPPQIDVWAWAEDTGRAKFG